MDVRHLTYFVVVAEELHFGRAAQRLQMAQPPLSQRIRELERELGVGLFDRNTRQVRLTEGGALLLEHARRILDDFDHARQAMDRIGSSGATALRVGGLSDTMPTATELILRKFHATYPDVMVELHELTTNEQLGELRNGELDVGMIRHPCDTVGLECGPVVREQFGVILREDHPLASRRIVELRDLNGISLIIFPRKVAPQVYDHILSVCRDQGFMPGTFRHARNPYFIQGLVLAGMGVHLNEKPTHQLQSGLVWRPLLGEPLHWETSSAWAKSRRTNVVAAFAEAIVAGLEASPRRQAPEQKPHGKPEGSPTRVAESPAART